MLRTITMLVLASLLAGCTTVFVPIPVPVNDRGIALPAAAPTEAATETPAATEEATEEPIAEPTEPAVDLPADAALFRDRYAEFERTYNAISSQLETMAFGDPAWREETARLALEWHDAIDRLRATTCPVGGAWATVCPGVDSAMAHFGFAAGDIEKAARENNLNYMANVRSQLLQGATFLTDALAPFTQK